MTPIEERLAEIEGRELPGIANRSDYQIFDDFDWLLSALREAVELAKWIDRCAPPDLLTASLDENPFNQGEDAAYFAMNKRAAAFLRGEFGTERKGESE